MPQYGFVIDQRKCIGCHACTVACKSENEVPVGQYRTWVKYVDKGAFPDVRRHFTVLRCNHCDEAPCVTICPVNALEKRPDSIVDLNKDQCIGCRSCMQACPYDALYLNEDTGTAEKCHYCAHRTEIGLKPACVVVCPEHAIVSGDVSNEASEIGTLLREQPTSQRKLEKGTKPRVWYVDALEESLKPGMAHEPDQWLWGDRQTQPAQVPGFESVPDLVTTLNVDHPPVWGWHIWAYLFTKNVAAGAMIAAPFLAWMGASTGWWAEAVALAFLGITMFFLVHDLGRPERFLKIVFQPNPDSWLVKGTWILMGFGTFTAMSLAMRLFGADTAADLVRWLNLPFAVMASGYTAFLFWQCRGRDLWLEKSLFAHLLVRAGLLGAGLAMLAGASAAGTMPFVALALVNGAWVWAERRHMNADNGAAKALRLIWATPAPAVSAINFFMAAAFGVIGGLEGDLYFQIVAMLNVTIALLVYERAWVRAGQALPNS